VLILALDASTDAATVAVACAEENTEPGSGREVLAAISAHSRSASETLLLATHTALSLAGTNLSEVERIVVGVGPGTFTGIRIALSTARSLALATDATLSRNSTLNALAAPALLSMEEPDALAVLDAKRRQVFAQRFAGDRMYGEILCLTPEELAVELTARDPPLVVGDGAVIYREVLSVLGHIPPDASPLHQVTAVGHVLSADLTPVSPHEVVPLYVRAPDAEARRDLNPWSKT
jgi:tRNA threonylcarbamoyladenosine biosynthesis protein TsaB